MGSRTVTHEENCLKTLNLTQTIILTGGNFNRGQLSGHPYMNTSEKAELTASIRHIERFSKSGLLIYNSEVADTAGWKQEEK